MGHCKCWDVHHHYDLYHHDELKEKGPLPTKSGGSSLTCLGRTPADFVHCFVDGRYTSVLDRSLRPPKPPTTIKPCFMKSLPTAQRMQSTRSWQGDIIICPAGSNKKKWTKEPLLHLKMWMSCRWWELLLVEDQVESWGTCLQSCTWQREELRHGMVRCLNLSTFLWVALPNVTNPPW